MRSSAQPSAFTFGLTDDQVLNKSNTKEKAPVLVVSAASAQTTPERQRHRSLTTREILGLDSFAAASPKLTAHKTPGSTSKRRSSARLFDTPMMRGGAASIVVGSSITTAAAATPAKNKRNKLFETVESESDLNLHRDKHSAASDIKFIRGAVISKRHVKTLGGVKSTAGAAAAASSQASLSQRKQAVRDLSIPQEPEGYVQHVRSIIKSKKEEQSSRFIQPKSLRKHHHTAKFNSRKEAQRLMAKAKGLPYEEELEEEEIVLSSRNVQSPRRRERSHGPIILIKDEDDEFQEQQRLFRPHTALATPAASSSSSFQAITPGYDQHHLMDEKPQMFHQQQQQQQFFFPQPLQHTWTPMVLRPPTAQTIFGAPHPSHSAAGAQRFNFDQSTFTAQMPFESSHRHQEFGGWPGAASAAPQWQQPKWPSSAMPPSWAATPATDSRQYLPFPQQISVIQGHSFTSMPFGQTPMRSEQQQHRFATPAASSFAPLQEASVRMFERNSGDRTDATQQPSSPGNGSSLFSAQSRSSAAADVHTVKDEPMDDDAAAPPGAPPPPTQSRLPFESAS